MWEHKDATYTHGTLVALAALWFVWRARAALEGVPAAPELRALPLLIVLSGAWLLAARANVLVIHAVLWPILAFTLLWAGAGWRAASAFAFPLGLMYFAIPIWEYLKPPLQWLSATVVGFLTSIGGIQAIVDGATIVLPTGTVYIALDCSGAHFLSVSLAVGAIAGELRNDRWSTRFLIMGLAALLSMAFNWLRILLIALAYLHADLKNALETMGHLTFGWWVFALDLIVFCLVLRFVPSTERAAPAQATQVPANGMVRGATGLLLAIVATLLLPMGSWLLQRMDRYPEPIPHAVHVPGVTGPLSADLRWQPTFEGAAWGHRAAYLANDRVIELYRNEYHRQRQGRELIGNGSSLFDPLAFERSVAHPVALQLSQGPAIDVNRVELLDKSGQHWLALYTYIVDDRAVASARQVQLMTAVRSLYSRPAAGVFAVAAPCVPDCATVSGELEQAAIRAYAAYESARSDS